MTDARPTRRLRSLVGLALLAVCLLAFGVRSSGLDQVFTGPGEVILRGDDAQYHARRAHFSVVHFPSVLVWDTYLNHPHGQRVAWPPLYPLALAAAARLLGGAAALEWVLAWASVVIGSFTVLVVYAIGRAVASRGVSIAAAAIYAVLPAAVSYSGVGNPDHHAAVALQGALLVAGYVWSVRSDVRGALLVAVHAGLALVRASLLLTWGGSLLYLAIGEPVWIATAALAGRRDSLAVYAAAALVSLALVVPWLAAAGATATPFSGIELSWLHPTVLLALAAVAALTATWERARPVTRAGSRALRLGAVAFAVGGALLLLAPLREGVAMGLAFFGEEQPWIARNYENVAIIRDGSVAIARFLYGELYLLIPVAPVVLLWRARDARVREPALILAAWATAFGALAVAFVRFGNDFAPVGAVAMACVLAEIGILAERVLGRMRSLAWVAPAVLGVAMLWSPLVEHAGAASRALAFVRDPSAFPPNQTNFHRDLDRFAERVRAVTPETAGFLDATERPEYGILCFPALGHAILQGARRPVTATPFGPNSYFDHAAARDSFRITNLYYAITSEERALAVARRLGVRYVVTAREGRPPAPTLLHRLHLDDGNGAKDVPRLEHFRLVMEWPARGVSLGWLSGSSRFITATPFKLFEIVPGAELAVAAAPGSAVNAEVAIRTASGRHFRYHARGQAADDGVARLRVPYSTEPAETAPIGPYQVTVGGRVIPVQVTEADVLEGRVVEVR